MYNDTKAFKHIVWFQMSSIPTPRRVTGNSKEEGVLKAIVFEGKCNYIKTGISWGNCFGGRVGWSQKSFYGRGMDIFLNSTLIYLISFQTNGSPGLEKCPTPPPTAEKGSKSAQLISLLWWHTCTNTSFFTINKLKRCMVFALDMTRSTNSFFFVKRKIYHFPLQFPFSLVTVPLKHEILPALKGSPL